MSNFLTYWNKLRNYVPSLSPEQAQDMVNEAWRDICDADDEWSFLHATEYWLAPSLITLASVGVTQNDDTVDLTIDGLVQIAGLNNPPLTLYQAKFGQGGPVYGIESSDVQQVTDGAMTSPSTTLTCATSAPFAAGDVGKLIRVAGAGAGGADLDTTIATYVSPTQVTLTDAPSTTVAGATVTWGSTITLDRLFRESTNADIQMILARRYYSPLSTDFARLDHIYDPILGYEFGWEIGDPDEIDRIDAQRTATGNAYRVFYREFDQDTALPVYELWPTPSAQRAFTVQYWRKSGEFTSDTEALPPQIPEQLLLMRARILAYEWAMVSDPDRDRRNSYANALGYVRSKYSTEGQPGRPLGLLEQAKRKDKSIYRKAFIRAQRRRPAGYPIDSRFAQSHDVGLSGWTGPY